MSSIKTPNPELARVLHPVSEEARAALRGDTVIMLLMDLTGSTPASVLYQAGLPFVAALDESLNEHMSFLLQRALMHGRPEVTNCLAPGAIYEKVFRKMGFTTLLVIPFHADPKTIMGLFICSKERQEYSSADIQLAELYGRLIASLLETFELGKLYEISSRTMQFMPGALRKLRAQEDLLEIIQAAFRECKPVMGTDRSVLILPDPDTNELLFFKSDAVSARFITRLKNFPVPHPFFHRMLPQPNLGGPVVFPDATKDPEWGWVQVEEGHQSFIGYPLCCQNRTSGFLFFYWTSPQRLDDIRYLMGELFADQVACSIAQVQAKNRQDGFRRITDNAADPILVHDLNGKILYANPSACRALGYSSEEILGLSVDAVDLYCQIATSRLEWDRTRESEAKTAEGFFRRKDGSTFPVEISRNRLDRRGSPALIAFIHDVARHKEIEDKQKKVIDEAHATNRAKSFFLSTVSHELRSPLNQIIGYCDIMMMESPDKAEMLKSILNAAEHLMKLVEDLTDIANLGRHNMQLHLQEVPINELVKHLTESRRESFPGKFHLSLRLDPSNPRCICDPTRVNQILTNLLDNAIKYSPNGGTISFGSQEYPTEVWVSVSDEGIGIDEADKEVIFEPFYQGDSGFSRRFGGLGIGLSLVRSMVIMQGGRIWAEKGESGKGSTFTFSLPKF